MNGSAQAILTRKDLEILTRKDLTEEEAYTEYVREKIRRGEEDFKNGRYYTVEEARRITLEEIEADYASRDKQRIKK